MKYKYIIYDMDGTVLDTLSDLTDAVNHSFRQFSQPEVSREDVRKAIGNGAAVLIKKCLPDTCPEELYKEVLAYYKDWYAAHSRIKTAPYPGIEELNRKLLGEGCKLAIVSNKPHEAVQELAAVFFPGVLELAIGESAAVRRKPWPDSLLCAVEKMGAAKEECVYIGDSETDIQTAANAGLDCISVAWGFRPEEELSAAGASKIVHSAEELYEALS